MKIKRDYLLKESQVSVDNLRQSIKTHGYQWTGQMLLQSFAEGELEPDQVPFRVIAEATGADRVLKRMDMTTAGGYLSTALTQEEAVDQTAFLNIAGQIVFTAIQDGFNESDGGTWDALVQVEDTPYNGEKVPRMGEIKDEEFEVHEGQPYPRGGFGEHWIETPVTTKHGQIVSVTREAVFFDRTGGRVLQQAASVGRRLRTGRLKRMLKTILGITNTYKEDGTSYNTYQTAGALWTNSDSKALTDYTDLDEAAQLAANNTDPDTGNPIEMMGSTLLVPPALKVTSRRIVNATSVDVGDADDAAVPVTRSINPIQGDVSAIVVSALMRKLLVDSGVSTGNADVHWLHGDFKRGFRYMQNWPLTVVQAPPGNDAEFERDIAASYKASERGVGATWQPRWVQKFTN